MAAARRNVLNGASNWEREEKATQQRDYAAQLQEQVRQKQAKQEQESARRKQEQREELAMLAAQQQDQGQSALPPPPASPQRGASQSLQLAAETRQQELLHSPPTLNGTVPLDNELSAGMTPFSQQVLLSPTKYGEAASTALAFSSGPSVFESLLREPGVGTRSVAFYEDLEALQRLTAEMEMVARHRRSVAQSGYTKPDFSLQQQQQQPSVAPPTHASPSCLRSTIELFHDKTELRDPGIDTPPTTQQTESQCEGLLGESVLVSLGSAELLSASPLPKPELGSHASESPTKGGRQLATAARSEGEDEDESDASAVVALCSHSEMRPFTPSSE